MEDETKLYFYMDDTSIPFEEGKNPYPRTKEDDEFDLKMIQKYNLAPQEDKD